MADNEKAPSFQIQKIYLKELSLEQPNSPQIFLEQENPQVNINLGLEAQPLGDNVYEVRVMVTVHTKIKDKTLFLIEVKQAGIFEVSGVPEDQMT